MLIAVDTDNGTWTPLSSISVVEVPYHLLQEWESGQVSDMEIARFAKENEGSSGVWFVANPSMWAQLSEDEGQA